MRGTEGGTALLEMPTDTITKPEELEDSALGTLKSSLTVIRNPSLDDRLGILMAANTLLHEDAKSFFHAYVIVAKGNIIYPTILQVDIAKSEKQSGNTPLYVVLYYNNNDLNNGSRYPVASEVPHEVCKITDDEFRRYEATLTFPRQRVVELTGLVNNMIQLIGERLAGKGFAFEEGKLVLPPNYASTRL